jgi:DNA-binding NtrC family response regulator
MVVRKKLPLDDSLMTIRKLSPRQIVLISLGRNDGSNIIREAYLDLLSQFHYNKTALVESLGLPRQSFYNCLSKYCINEEDIRQYRIEKERLSE